MEINLHEYLPEDFERLYELDRACYPPGIAYSRRTLRRFLNFACCDCLVAELGGQAVGPRLGEIAGFILSDFANRRGHVVTIDVAAQFRREGVGSRLLQAAEARLAARGVRQLELETAIDNHAAIAFWRKHGYVTRGLLKNYYPGRRDAYCMTKELAGC